MKKRWYVINSIDNIPDWDDKKDQTREFTSKGKAVQRACSLAKETPHAAFLVCESVLAYAVETKPVRPVALT